jgi:hypothetical protein
MGKRSGSRRGHIIEVGCDVVGGVRVCHPVGDGHGGSEPHRGEGTGEAPLTMVSRIAAAVAELGEEAGVPGEA